MSREGSDRFDLKGGVKRVCPGVVTARTIESHPHGLLARELSPSPAISNPPVTLGVSRTITRWSSSHIYLTVPNKGPCGKKDMRAGDSWCKARTLWEQHSWATIPTGELDGELLQLGE